MKKIFNILILFIFSIMLFGCIEPDIIAPSYKVDLTLIDDEMYINEFDVSLIRIKYTDVKGDITFISCNESMFTEEDYNKLLNRMNEMGMETTGLEWYLNLRRYGGCVHSGFGMGFERLLIYLTGVENIRDVIPYPRTPGNCEY